MKPDDVLLTPAQAANKYPFIARSTLYSALQAGLLPHYRLPSRNGARGKLLVAEADLLAWVEANRHEATGRSDAPPAPPRSRPPFRHLKL